MGLMRCTVLLPAAVSLNRGCEDRPSRRKEGWEMGTEGAGAGVGPPGGRGYRERGREGRKEGSKGGMGRRAEIITKPKGHLHH